MKKKVLVIVFTAFSVISISAIFFFYQVFNAANILVNSKRDGIVLIPKGADIFAVSDSLQKRELVNDIRYFRFVTRFLNTMRTSNRVCIF